MPTSPLSFSRRGFLRSAGALAATVVLRPRLLAAGNPNLFSMQGIAAPIEQATALHAAGADFLTAAVDGFLAPDQGEDVFQKSLDAVAASPIPVLACNNFIRAPHLRCVGADAAHDQVLAWADLTFRRAKRAGVKTIVFGSSGSRRLRNGWTKEQADPQFIALLTRMGPLAEAQGVTVAVEQLRRQECNYINHLAEAAAIIRAVNHPHVRVLADFYHMNAVGDTPDDLRNALDVVVQLEIAEQVRRGAPGISGEDFRPFFRVLRAGRFNGPISIEGNWTLAQVAPAFGEIRRQTDEV